MCIIAIKKAGVDMPTTETIRTMWKNNQDGAGFAYVKDGRVRIRKGFMKLSDFEKALAEELASVDIRETPLLMHFRIATHGGTTPANCHPFPICDNVEMLKKPICHTSVAVAHNGIIPNRPRAGISDTMEYIITQLSPLKDHDKRFYRNKHLRRMIENGIQSKMAFLSDTGEVYTIGKFETCADGGMIYSNGSYLPRVSFANTDTRTSPFVLPWRKGQPKFLMTLPDDIVLSDRETGLVYEGGDFGISQNGTLYMFEWETGSAYENPDMIVHGRLPKYDWEQASAYDCYKSINDLIDDIDYADDEYLM